MVKDLQTLHNGVFLTKLLKAIGIGLFLEFIDYMLTCVTPRAARAQASKLSHQDISSGAQPIFNALAFGCKDFLPKTWRYVAFAPLLSISTRTNLGNPFDQAICIPGDEILGNVSNHKKILLNSWSSRDIQQLPLSASCIDYSYVHLCKYWLFLNVYPMGSSLDELSSHCKIPN